MTKALLVLQNHFIVDNKFKKSNFNQGDSPSSYHGKRKLSFGRRIYYLFGLPLLLLLINILWKTYRIEKIIGKEIVARVINDNNIYAPTYWHQHTILCMCMIRGWITQGFKTGFIISPSVDGEVPARIAKSWGAKVIRGSSVRTGALAMRGIHKIMKQGFSIVSAADGPLGPKYEFKSGVVLISKIGSAPILPLSCAAEKAWYLNRWDDFMIPKPFSRVVLAIGEPIHPDKSTTMDELQAARDFAENSINSLSLEAQKIFD